MFPTSDDYKKRIKALDRLFSLHIEIKHSKGTLVLTDEHIALGSFKHVSASQPSDDFTIGGTVASTLEFGIVNDIAYDDIVFDGAIIQPSIGVCLKPPGGHHYRHLELGEYPHWELGEYKHEQLMGMPLDITEEDFEYVPLGYFIVDEVNRLQTTITIKAVDEMIKLDKPYSESQLTYPATLSAIFADICSHCQVQQGTSSFVNMDYEVKERPVEDNVTFRTVLGWVAELAGSFAIFDRTSKLRLKWYEPTGMEYTGMNRFDFKPYDHEVQITGIIYSDEDENKTYIVGTDDYVIDISNNALLQDKYETVLPKILDRVEDTKFYPFESDWQGDPALEPGDMITHHSETGFEYDTLITSTMFKYRGKSQFKGQGLPNKDNGLRNSTDQKIAQVTRKTNKRIEREVSALEQAQEQATKLLTDKLGGYVFKRENELLIMDAPNPERATKVWRWNLNGLGYSKNGINGPYETAITMDGQIVADFITTGILNASLIKAGELTGITIKTESGDSRLEMSDNSFKGYQNGVKRVEVKHDNIIFYDPNSEKGGEIIALPAEDQYDDPMIMVRSDEGLVYVGSENPWDLPMAGIRIVGVDVPSGEVPNIGIQVREPDGRDAYLNLGSRRILLRADNLITLFANKIYADGLVTTTVGNLEIEHGICVKPSNTAYYGIGENEFSLIQMDYNGLIFNNRVGNNVLEYYRDSGEWLFDRSVHINRNFSVSGSKNSLQETENYGERLINAYETAEYYYGDIGSGIINEQGECIVYIDEILQECVNTNIKYHVFTQTYSGKIDKIQRESNYFIVYGEPETEFSWELKAKRKGYEHCRLEQPDKFNHDDFTHLDDELVENNDLDRDKIIEEELIRGNQLSPLERELTYDLSEKLLEV